MCVCIILLMPGGRVGDEKVLYARQQVDGCRHRRCTDFYIPTLIIKCWITPRGFFLQRGSHNQIKFYVGLTLVLFYIMPWVKNAPLEWGNG
jgi:hypothetical protein